MRILFIGDIFAKVGRDLVKRGVPALVRTHEIDLVIANGENSAGGFGITREISKELFDTGIAVMTSGNHVWDKREILAFIDEEPRLLRPFNYPAGVPGRGSTIVTTAAGTRVGVLNLMGRVFMNAIDDPFTIGRAEVERLRAHADVVFVDFHAEATSEKVALGLASRRAGHRGRRHAHARADRRCAGAAGRHRLLHRCGHDRAARRRDWRRQGTRHQSVPDRPAGQVRHGLGSPAPARGHRHRRRRRPRHRHRTPEPHAHRPRGPAVNSLFDLPFEDEPLDPETVRPLETPVPLNERRDSQGASPPKRVADDEPAATRDGGPTGPRRRRGRPRLPTPDSRLPPTGAGAERSSTPRTYSVSELTHAVRQSLEQQFGRVWVEGEIADCTNSQGNIYFTLKDGGAQLSAVLWRTDAARLRFRLTTGLHVLVKGRVSVYVPRGRYQLLADSIEPKGAGALQVAFEQLKKRLQAEGLFDPARKRPLPMLPRRIGVVTSLEGAALRDVLRVLRTRRAPADIVISPTRVQGEGAGAEIARAIARVSRVAGVDVLIVGRGGGSLEDLWAFNEEVVARAIAASPVPVIAAVGHEVDTTMADFVADVRAATPSQAAEIVVRQASEFRDRLATARRQMAAAPAQPPRPTADAPPAHRTAPGLRALPRRGAQS